MTDPGSKQTHMNKRSRHNHTPAFRGKVSLAAISRANVEVDKIREGLLEDIQYVRRD